MIATALIMIVIARPTISNNLFMINRTSAISRILLLLMLLLLLLSLSLVLLLLLSILRTVIVVTVNIISMFTIVVDYEC